MSQRVNGFATLHATGAGTGPVVDQALVRQLQARVGSRRQRALEEFRRDGQPIPTGADARAHTEHLLSLVLNDHESEQVEDGHDPLHPDERRRLEAALKARLFGAGSLEQLLEIDDVEDIAINGWPNVFLTYADGRKERVAPVATSDADLEEAVRTIAAHDGLSARPFDVVNYDVTLRLPDGSRLHAVQSVSATGLSISIRKHRFIKVTLGDLIEQQTLTPDLSGFLAAAVRARKNIMIAGAVSAGKTTLLRALASETDPLERLITVERAIELGLHEDAVRHPDCVALEERLPNVEGVGGVSLAQLVRDSLRMNPIKSELPKLAESLTLGAKISGEQFLSNTEVLQSWLASSESEFNDVWDLSHAAFVHTDGASDTVSAEEPTPPEDAPLPGQADVTELGEPYDLASVREDGCFLPEDELRPMLERLKSKKNLVLQGPPGTGKTWLARRLGWALCEERDPRRVQILQFHPSLAYEDFVRGWRPSTSRGGRRVEPGRRAVHPDVPAGGG